MQMRVLQGPETGGAGLWVEIERVHARATALVVPQFWMGRIATQPKSWNTERGRIIFRQRRRVLYLIRAFVETSSKDFRCL